VAQGERPDVWRDEDEWPPERVLRRKRAAAYRLGLHTRQYEVLLLIADGLTNRQIGERLYAPEETVKSDVKAILAALGARHRAHAVAQAFRRDLLI
jgi:DNA-binding NarL/FixJ family response regulator